IEPTDRSHRVRPPVISSYALSEGARLFGPVTDWPYLLSFGVGPVFDWPIESADPSHRVRPPAISSHAVSEVARLLGPVADWPYFSFPSGKRNGTSVKIAPRITRPSRRASKRSTVASQSALASKVELSPERSPV